MVPGYMFGSWAWAFLCGVSSAFSSFLPAGGLATLELALGVNECVHDAIHGAFPPHTQCPRDRLRTLPWNNVPTEA